MLEREAIGALVVILLLVMAAPLQAGAPEVALPPKPAAVTGVAGPVASLDGEWQFRATADAPAKPIAVPGEWAMQDFTVPVGGWAEYRRSFDVAPDWAGHAVGVRFDGVHAVCAVEVNGKSVGYHEGGFVPFELDVTAAVRPGQVNEIVVRVQCESTADTLSCITQYAAHPVGGIVRGVSLICRPKTYARSLTHAVTLDGNAATLAVHTELTGPGEVTHTLTDPQSGIVATGQGVDATLRVDNAKLWTSETPYLYDLRTTIVTNGKPVETLKQRVGLRQIRVDGNRLLVNGEPVKLLGVNRHEIHPLTGRSITAELCRRDVEMFRAANVNVIRTSHYPPSEAFLDACDELGMFVECEAAICWVGHDASPAWKTWDRADEKFLPAFMRASEEMVAAYRHHASIFAWSPANESAWTPLFTTVVDRIRTLDPTRVTIFHDQAWGKYNNEGSTADIANMHYPSPSDWPKLNRPIWFGEYAHVECYNRRELVTDPFVRDDWARPLAAMSDAIWARPDVVGGCIWAGIDDIFHLPNGNLCGYGHWGVIDAWRRTKPETDGVFKAFTPVRVLDRVVKTGRPVTLRVQNRFNFLNLLDTKIEWQCGTTLGTVTTNIAPHKTGEIVLPLEAEGPGWSALVTITDPRGVIVAREVVSIAVPPTIELPQPPLANAGSAMAETLRALKLDGELALVPVPMVLPLNNAGGVQSAGGMQLANVIDPFTPMPTGIKLKPVPATQSATGDTLRYAVETDDVSGTIAMTAHSERRWTLSYRLTLKKDVNPRQWGVVFTLPATFDKLSFDHETPFGWYPPDAIGRPTGTAKADPVRRAFVEEPRVEPRNEWRLDANALGTNDFRATRAHVRRAGLWTADGRAVVITSPDASQATRAWVDGDVVRLLVAGFNTGGSDHFFATHYRTERRPLKAGQVIRSTFELRVRP